MLKKHKFLIAGFLSLTIALVLQQLLFSEANTALFLEYVKERLRVETGTLDDQIFRLKRKLKQNESIDFESFLEDSKYPIAVYRNKKLIYWSDHTLYLDYYDVAGYYDERCFETPREKSIYLSKKSFLTLKNQDYEIVGLIPLLSRYQEANNFLAPTLNRDIFLQGQGVKVSLANVGTPVINPYEVYLFSISFTDDFTYYSSHRWLVIVFVFMAVVLLGIQLSKYLNYLLDQGKAGRATLLLGLTLLWIRSLMLYYRIPYSYIPYEIFDPRTFAVSILSPSLGDLLLNVCAFAILGGFIFLNYPRIIRYRSVLPLNELGKSVVVTCWVIGSYVSMYMCHSILETMLSNSIYSSASVFVDISRRIDLSASNVTSLLIFIMVSTVYFFVSHITAKLLSKLGDSVYDAPIRFVAGSLIFYLLSLAVGVDDLFLFNLNALYLIFITFFNLPFYIQKSDYSTYIYLFSWAIGSATVGAYSIVRFHEVKDLERKGKYATELILENDQIAEFYLNNLMERVAEDSRVPVLLEQGKVEPILTKVRRTYMKRYLDKYQIQVQIYNSQKEVMLGRGDYEVISDRYKKPEYKTEYDNIYFINEVATGRKDYVVFMDLKYRGILVGHIILQLRQRRITQNSIHQNFFIQQNYYDDFLPEDYSYAIYGDGRLVYSSGDFAYDDPFLERFRHPAGFWMNELETGSHNHILQPNDQDQQIVVSSPKYPLSDAFTNFSFLFLLLVFTLLVVLTVYNLYLRTDNQKLNFNTKIQLYLNFAFFLPLIVVSLIIVSILNNANSQDTKARYLEKAQNIANELRTHVENCYPKPFRSQDLEDLEERLSSIASTTQADIDIFDGTGKLMMSSQQYIYENRLLSGYINPNAYSQIVEQHQNRTVLDESLGVRTYSAAYVSLRSSKANEVIAVVGVPFFGMNYQYQRQVIDVLSKIMQVFAAILILLLGLSYISALSLTAPLRLIRQELRKVSFQDQNKPLDYQSDDEIGLLVNEYNKMLLKLEESRRALSRSEKESAWREMAKQVAHEIKNPLTPMKLNLQQLQRVTDESHPMALRSIKMLIAQVDTLSDIATSFSAFARMPLPTEEPVDLCNILKEIVQLHDKREGSKVELDLGEEALPVIGDERLLSRIFSNLIINGIQAVPEGRDPKIRIEAGLKQGRKALLKFVDNGGGIPEETRPKVFLPNFTTKSSGSGIGLAIAKRGIEQLGGRIWFETETNKGTTFFIEMPILKK